MPLRVVSSEGLFASYLCPCHLCYPWTTLGAALAAILCNDLHGRHTACSRSGDVLHILADPGKRAQSAPGRDQVFPHFVVLLPPRLLPALHLVLDADATGFVERFSLIFS